jgi:hypothetical protein
MSTTKKAGLSLHTRYHVLLNANAYVELYENPNLILAVHLTMRLR